MAKKLVIDFVGRICFITKDGDMWAIFLDAEHNPRLRLRPHRPLLNAPMSMIATQSAAKDAVVTTATFVNPIIKGGPFIDGAGIWSLAGFDMRLSGVAPASGNVNIADLADLNAIVASVDPRAHLEPRVLDDDPRRFGVLARLKIPYGADVTAVTEDATVKTFQPGGYAQPLATHVKCVVDFENDLVGPRLRLRSFRTGKSKSYQFDGLKYDEVHVVMTNLCNCIKHVGQNTGAVAIDDPEFVIYYELLESTTRLAPRKKPVPTVPIAVMGGIEIPECYDPARGRI